MNFKKLTLLTALIAVSLFVFLGISNVSAKKSKPKLLTAAHQVKASFKMPEIETPIIPKREVDLTSYGAIGDGVVLNTDAFQKAIDELAAKGGGRLIVPEGVWHSGPIQLKDNIELHLVKNALLVFSTDKDLYPIVPAIFEGRDTYRCMSPIWARDAKNIAITGEGIIDGSGDAWRMVKQGKMAPSEWNALIKSGGVLSKDKKTWYPSESFAKGAGDSDQNISNWATTIEDFESIKDFLRPVMIYMQDCSNILLEGVVFQNSPCWNIHLVMSDNITVEDIVVRCPWYAQNGDGIDIESCDKVLVSNSFFDVGDDAICIKSGKDEDGRKRGIPSTNIMVDNCTVFHGHGGFVVGSEMSGGVKNVKVSNCRFAGTDVGLRFKSNRGRGGVVEDIFIENIVMNDIATEALLFDLFYGGKSAVEQLQEGDEGVPNTDMPAMPVDETTPEFRNIYVSNVICKGARRAMLFNGLPEKNVSNIVVENSQIHAQIGAQINESNGVVLRNVQITPESGPALMINNVKNLTAINLIAPEGLESALEITGTRNENITIESNEITAQNSYIVKSAAKKVTIK